MPVRDKPTDKKLVQALRAVERVLRAFSYPQVYTFDLVVEDEVLFVEVTPTLLFPFPRNYFNLPSTHRLALWIGILNRLLDAPEGEEVVPQRSERERVGRVILTIYEDKVDVFIRVKKSALALV